MNSINVFGECHVKLDEGSSPIVEMVDSGFSVDMVNFTIIMMRQMIQEQSGAN